MPLINLLGQRFNRFTVVGGPIKKNRRIYWRCRCRCGNERIVIGYNLTSGHSKSCGCYHSEVKSQDLKKLNTKHNHSNRDNTSRIYGIWGSMIQRCTNPIRKGYKNYGGRGITVCKRWHNFENFLNDMGEPPSPKHTLDRIDNDGNYCKENCTWSTRMEQCNNTRRNRMVTIGDKTQSVSMWAREHGIKPSVAHQRIMRGWPDIDAVTIPLGTTRSKK